MRATNASVASVGVLVTFLSFGFAVLGFPTSLRATTATFQQNANGQFFQYTAPDGHILSGYFPNNKNWSQSYIPQTYFYGSGQQYIYEIAPSNWSVPDAPMSGYDILIDSLPVTLDVSVSVASLTLSNNAHINIWAPVHSISPVI